MSINVEMIGNQEPKPRRIQVRTRPDNPVRREPGQSPRHVGQHVDRVRNHQQYAIRRVLGQWRHDVLEYRHVPLQQIKTALAGVLPGPGGDDAEVGAGGGGVVGGGGDLGAGEEGGGMLEVQHLASELLFSGVEESELVGEVLGEDGLSDGHSDVADAHHRYLGGAFGRRRRCSAGDAGEEGFGEVEAAGTEGGGRVAFLHVELIWWRKNE